MKTHWAIPALLAAVMAVGCSDSNGPAGSATTGLNPNTTNEPHVALTVTPGTGVAPDPEAGYTITDGGNTLLLTKAEVVLGEIELKQGCGVGTRGDGHSGDDGRSGGGHDHGSSDDSSSDDSSSDDSSSDDSSSDDSSSDDGDSARFEAGPFVLDVPLGRTAEAFVSVAVPEGSYGRIEFVIQRFTSRLFDASILEEHPDLVGSSIRIEGTFDDGTGAVPFVYRTDLQMTQKIDLDDPLVIDETSGATELTLHLGLDTWFVDDAGVLIDPATANDGGANEHRVEGNIRDSMDAFEVHRH